MTYHDIAAQISRLKPGDALTISRHILDCCSSMPGFSIVDCIMESIVGSAYSFVPIVDYRTRSVTFQRLAQPLADGLRTYVSPDRRHLYGASIIKSILSCAQVVAHGHATNNGVKQRRGPRCFVNGPANRQTKSNGVAATLAQCQLPTM